MATAVYNSDGLSSHHNHDFMRDPRFVSAYKRGMKAAAGKDYGWYWRVYMGLWAANHGKQVPGDFVECGTNVGFMSSAIMHYLGWDTLGKQFYLLDTFKGLDERYVSPKELEEGALEKNRKAIESGFYVTDVDKVRANFSEWRNHKIIVGPVPETLPLVDAERVAFLHIDMNSANPEVAALRYFWDRLSRGAVVLLDDYAFHGYHEQKKAMDALAQQLNVAIASLPTGQGLLIRP